VATPYIPNPGGKGDGDGHPTRKDAMEPVKDPRNRSAIRQGALVDIVTKGNQRSGRTVRGTVREILTGTGYHPHGIKVRLTDGQVGRVKGIVDPEKEGEE